MPQDDEGTRPTRKKRVSRVEHEERVDLVGATLAARPELNDVEVERETGVARREAQKARTKLGIGSRMEEEPAQRQATAQHALRARALKRESPALYTAYRQGDLSLEEAWARCTQQVAAGRTPSTAAPDPRPPREPQPRMRVPTDLVVEGLWERQPTLTQQQIGDMVGLSGARVNEIVMHLRTRRPEPPGVPRHASDWQKRHRDEVGWLRNRGPRLRLAWVVLEPVLRYAYHHGISTRDLLIMGWQAFPASAHAPADVGGKEGSCDAAV